MVFLHHKGQPWLPIPSNCQNTMLYELSYFALLFLNFPSNLLTTHYWTCQPEWHVVQQLHLHSGGDRGVVRATTKLDGRLVGALTAQLPEINCTLWHTPTGISPVKVLPSNFIFASGVLLNCAGTSPTRVLNCRSNRSRLVNFPNAVGITPDKWFSASAI
jgi:hypothetical protein